MSTEHEKSLPRRHSAAENRKDCPDGAQTEQARHPHAREEIETRIAKNEHRQGSCGNDDDRTEDVDADEVLIFGMIFARAHERVVASADGADEHAADSGEGVENTEGGMRRRKTTTTDASENSQEVASSELFVQKIEKDEE